MEIFVFRCDKAKILGYSIFVLSSTKFFFSIFSSHLFRLPRLLPPILSTFSLAGQFFTFARWQRILMSHRTSGHPGGPSPAKEQEQEPVILAGWEICVAFAFSLARYVNDLLTFVPSAAILIGFETGNRCKCLPILRNYLGICLCDCDYSEGAFILHNHHNHQSHLSL